MIERHRGEHQAQEIWHRRPTVSPTTAPVASPTRSAPPSAPAADIEQIAQQAATAAVAELAATVASAQATRRRRSRARITVLMLAVAIALFIVSAGHGLTNGARHASALPTTPRQWVDVFEAAAMDNPQRVCTQLLSPRLAAAYAAAAHGTCTNYFARISSTSLRVRRILQDGSTAVVELHQTIEKTDWNVVLDRRGRGWRGVDLTPGRPLR